MILYNIGNIDVLNLFHTYRFYRIINRQSINIISILLRVLLIPSRLNLEDDKYRCV